MGGRHLTGRTEDRSGSRSLAQRLLAQGHLRGADLADSVPAQFGRYEVVSLLGRGGMAVVYLARDPLLGRLVAVKVLGSGGWGLARFQRERQVLAALRHPNIVEVFDAGNVDDQEYFVMEYVGEHSLETAPLGRLERAALLPVVARALEATHRAGVVHRDLKPSNVLLAPDGRPVLADFGLARLEDSAVTKVGATLGTPVYMSPEQVTGSTVDARTDVYALGVMLYETLTGEVPFQAENMVALAVEITSGAPRPLRELDPSISPELEAVALRAMAREPTERFPSAGAFAEALAAALEHCSPLERRTTLLPAPTHGTGRARLALLPLGALAAAVLAVAAAVTLTARPEQDAVSVAPVATKETGGVLDPGPRPPWWDSVAAPHPRSYDELLELSRAAELDPRQVYKACFQVLEDHPADEDLAVLALVKLAAADVERDRTLDLLSAGLERHLEYSIPGGKRDGMFGKEPGDLTGHLAKHLARLLLARREYARVEATLVRVIGGRGVEMNPDLVDLLISLRAEAMHEGGRAAEARAVLEEALREPGSSGRRKQRLEAQLRKYRRGR